MNLLKRTTPWMVASLLAVTSLFGQERRSHRSFETNHDRMHAQMMPAYNAPARIEVRGSWDVYGDISFIYWQMSQDNMEYALSATSSLTQYEQPNTQIKGNFVEQHFKYKPGFKLGLGMNLDTDSWDIYGEYTRIHGSDHSNTNGTASGLVFSTFLHPLVVGSNAFNSASSSWTSKLDIGDVEIARSYYVGNSLTFRPAFGARAAWIQQIEHAQYRNTSNSLAGTAANGVGITVTPVLGTANSYFRTHSWALGPRAGLTTNWMLGQGIRMVGSAYGDILYTKYKLQAKSLFVQNSNGIITSWISKTHVGLIRTHLDLEMGFGWGSYFDSNNWHIDLLATYGFQVFFDQNMVINFRSGAAAANSGYAMGNLYAQGLTFTTRLDF
jgi:hypothetical protein